VRLTERQEQAYGYWRDGHDLSVLGVSGTGKTTLALHLALEHGDNLPVRVLICTNRLPMHLAAYEKLIDKRYGRDSTKGMIKTGRLSVTNEPFVPEDRCVLVIDEFQFNQYEFVPPEVLGGTLASPCRKILCSYCLDPLALRNEPPPDTLGPTFKTIDLGVKYCHYLIR